MSAAKFAARVLKETSIGNLRLTPFVDVFAGISNHHQSLYQGYIIRFNGIPLPAYQYFASVGMQWIDVGGRLGFKIDHDLSENFRLEIKSGLGAAYRQTGLSASDLDLAPPGPFSTFTSAISQNADRLVFVANQEIGVRYKHPSGLTARGFLGLTFDDRVPGIASPVLDGPSARILFNSEFSYYGGISLISSF